MIQVSVLSPTIRGLQALRPIEQSLRDQSLQSFEWLLEIGDGRTHTLNRDFNAMLRRARGELVVIVEDWCWFPPDGLQKFYGAYKSSSGYFFTAPVPKAQSYNDLGKRIRYSGSVVEEWRSARGGMIDWRHFEIDWAAAPLQALKELGGFDTYQDQKWANDNSNLAYRAMKAGWLFWNLKDNPAMGLNHNAIWAHPFRDRHDPEWSEARLREFDAGLKLEPIC